MLTILTRVGWDRAILGDSMRVSATVELISL